MLCTCGIVANTGLIRLQVTYLRGNMIRKKNGLLLQGPLLSRFPFSNQRSRRFRHHPVSWTNQQTGISAHFLGLKRPSDVTEDTLSLLNVTFLPECDFETLLSSVSNNAELHLPPKSWLDSHDDDKSSQTAGSTPTLLSNGRRAPERKDFYVRVRELYFKNADAFSTLTRKANGDQARLRLAHFPKILGRT